MQIIFTKSVPVEGGLVIDNITVPKEIGLWEDHKNNVPGWHPRSGQPNLLVIYNMDKTGGWFLTIKNFRYLLREGIIKIVG